MNEQQLLTHVQDLRNANLVQLKLIEYMQADIESKDTRIEQLQEQLEASRASGTEE